MGRDQGTKGPVLAGIDIGTLTCRLLVGRVSADEQLEELHGERRILRLGEGVDREGRLKDSAISRVLDTLREWRRVIQDFKPEAVSVVATSAVRDAANRDAFLDQIRRGTGFEVEVLTGDEEARRTLLGIRSGLPRGVSDVLGLDIGGGSTEFILDRKGSQPVVLSLELGVVRLTERLLRNDPPTREELEAARTFIRTQLEKARTVVGDVHGTCLVGTAGTITTLAAMDLRLEIYDKARIHNYRLTLDAVRTLEDALLSRTSAERRAIPGLDPFREDLIVGGTLILLGVMNGLGFRDCLVSDLGLREGLLIHLARRHRAVPR